MMPNNSRMLCSSSTTSTRVSATDRGEAEGEGAAGARRRLHVNLAAVLLHDPLHEGEAEPAAVEFRGEEGLEDVTEVLARDALTGVAHAHLEPIAHHPCRHPDLDGARERGEWIADLVRDIRRHAAERCQAIGLAEALLHRPHRGEVLARADHAELLVLVAGLEGPEGESHGDAAVAGPGKHGLVTARAVRLGREVGLDGGQ